jgi:hypothetical protein
MTAQLAAVPDVEEAAALGIGIGLVKCPDLVRLAAGLGCGAACRADGKQAGSNGDESEPTEHQVLRATRCREGNGETELIDGRTICSRAGGVGEEPRPAPRTGTARGDPLRRLPMRIETSSCRPPDRIHLARYGCMWRCSASAQSPFRR